MKLSGNYKEEFGLSRYAGKEPGSLFLFRKEFPFEGNHIKVRSKGAEQWIEDLPVEKYIVPKGTLMSQGHLYHSVYALIAHKTGLATEAGFEQFLSSLKDYGSWVEA